MKTTATKKVEAVKPVCNDLAEHDGATPRPWRSEPKDGVMVVYGVKHNTIPVCMTDGDDQLETEANAALIVEAVNNYDALVAALDKINAIVKEGVIHRNETGKPQWSAFDEIRNIVAALESVRGGKAVQS
jgi:hypothetical protein